MTKRKTYKRRKKINSKKQRKLCKNIGSTQLEVDILNQRIQQIHRKNMELTKKKKLYNK